VYHKLVVICVGIYKDLIALTPIVVLQAAHKYRN